MISDTPTSLPTESGPQRSVVAATLLIVTLVCYLPAMSGDFVWDDEAHVSQNATLRSLRGLLDIWTRRGSTTQYYPLTYTSFWIEYQIWGLNRIGYHLSNVLLHAINAFLVWELLRRLRVPGAILAAAVFAVHPVEVESVAWISERKNVLATCFVLLSMLAYLRFNAGGYALAVLLFLCALLSKTVACSMPAVMVLLLWWKQQLTTRQVRLLLPFLGIGLVMGLGTAQMELAHVGAVGQDWELSIPERCIIASRAVWFYVGKLVWPADLTFSYPRWHINAGDPRQYVPLVALIAAVALLALGTPRWGRGPLVAVLIYVGTLFPALGFINVYPMRWTFVADHYQYMSSIAMIALVIGGLGGVVRANAAMVCGVVLLAVLGTFTWRQARIYRDHETLWRDTLRKNPSSWLGQHNLGALLLHSAIVDQQEGRRAQAEPKLVEAVTLFDQVIRVRPTNMLALVSRARALDRLQRWDQAVQAFEDAAVKLEQHLRSSPNDSESRVNLGNVQARLGRYDEAREHYEEALRRNPYVPGARKALETLRQGGFIPASRPARD